MIKKYKKGFYEICIDFDGTCVTHKYLKVGQTVPGCIGVLKDLVDQGNKLILFTMRSDMEDGEFGGEAGLTVAVQWFKDNDIKLYGIQTNPTQKDWTESPKAYGQVYIGDAAIGCPLVYPTYLEGRPYVNWYDVRIWLNQNGILK